MSLKGRRLPTAQFPTLREMVTPKPLRRCGNGLVHCAGAKLVGGGGLPLPPALDGFPVIVNTLETEEKTRKAQKQWTYWTMFIEKPVCCSNRHHL